MLLGEKISLGITVLLSFSVFMLLIAENIPATSERVPLIGIYLTITMSLTSLSLILTIFILQLHYANEFDVAISPCLYNFTTNRLACFVGMSTIVDEFEQNKRKHSSFKCLNSVVFRRLVSKFNKPPPMENTASETAAHLNGNEHSPFSNEQIMDTLNSNSLINHNENSNDFIRTKSLREKTKQQIICEWRLVGLILDRLFFWIFFIFSVFSTLFLLLIVPILKNNNIL